MLISVVAVSIFYMYSVNKTVVLIAQRESIESKIASNIAIISKLEAVYISEKSNVTLELAKSLGYGQAGAVVYVPKKSVSILTRNSSRIQ